MQSFRCGFVAFLLASAIGCSSGSPAGSDGFGAADAASEDGGPDAPRPQDADDPGGPADLPSGDALADGSDASFEPGEPGTDAAESEATELPADSSPGPCGNGVLDEGEFCDPGLEALKDCRYVSSLYVAGVASCADDCRWDFGECESFKAECGNGLLEPGEECETALNATASCPSVSKGFIEGVAVCTNECRFNTSGCTPTPSVCGDGLVEGFEQCDEGDKNGSNTCSKDCIAMQNGVPTFFEPPDHNGNTFEVPEAFMAQWVCNNPTVRNGWRKKPVAEVEYDLRICTNSGVEVMNLADLRTLMDAAAKYFEPAHIRLIERKTGTFVWKDCTVNWDDEKDVGSFLEFVNENVADENVLAICVVEEIPRSGQGVILGFSGPDAPITIRPYPVGVPETIAHEAGHKFGLSHTHECVGDVIETPDTCLVRGDQLCDTPPDPGPWGLENGACGGWCDCTGRCGGAGACFDSSAPDCSNLMSYYHCLSGDFSNEQLDYMRCNLENEMAGFKHNCEKSAEKCNGKDDDCDGQVDEKLTRACGSAVGECSTGKQTCSSGKWGACAGAFGGSPEVCDGKDNDCDGMTDEGLVQACGTDVGECKKGVQKCFGGSWDTPCLGGIDPKPEVCDNRDNDCDGQTDEGIDWMKVPSLKCPALGVCAGGAAYPTCDAGGHWGCHYPAGYMAKECKPMFDLPGCDLGDPNDPSCSDGKDNDCDGVVDDLKLTTSCLAAEAKLTQAVGKKFGDGCWHGLHGLCASNGGVYKCVPLSSMCGVDYDCVGGVHPDIAEQCDDLDHDCDGKTWDRNDLDGDGFGDCGCDQNPAGPKCDCNEKSVGIHPGASETCNGKDDDCDGKTDEGVTTTYFLDADKDGFGTSATKKAACDRPSGYVTDDSDCCDTDAYTYPGADYFAGESKCGGWDHDCDGTEEKAWDAKGFCVQGPGTKCNKVEGWQYTGPWECGEWYAWVFDCYWTGHSCIPTFTPTIQQRCR